MLRSIFLFFVPKINQFSSPLIFVSVQKNPVYYIQYFYFSKFSSWKNEIPSPLIFVSIRKNTKSCILHSIFLLFPKIDRWINFLLERVTQWDSLSSYFRFNTKKYKIFYTTFNISTFRSKFSSWKNEIPSPLIFVSIQKNTKSCILNSIFLLFVSKIDQFSSWKNKIPSPLVFVSIQKNTKSCILHSIFLLFVPKIDQFWKNENSLFSCFQ